MCCSHPNLSGGRRRSFLDDTDSLAPPTIPTIIVGERARSNSDQPIAIGERRRSNSDQPITMGERARSNSEQLGTDGSMDKPSVERTTSGSTNLSVGAVPGETREERIAR